MSTLTHPHDGHDGHDHGDHPEGNAAPGAQHEPAHRMDGDAPAANASNALKDPVCGMVVTTASQHHHQHAGTTYYFCSGACLTKFAAKPGTYLHAPAAVRTDESPAGARYTCPMHPEIVRDKPGDCPKCGMALVPIAGACR